MRFKDPSDGAQWWLRALTGMRSRPLARAQSLTRNTSRRPAATIARTFLAQFVEARRAAALNTAPSCAYSPNVPPLELRGAPPALADGANGARHIQLLPRSALCVAQTTTLAPCAHPLVPAPLLRWLCLACHL